MAAIERRATAASDDLISRKNRSETEPIEMNRIPNETREHGHGEFGLNHVPNVNREHGH